jgi:hypothetical protein
MWKLSFASAAAITLAILTATAAMSGGAAAPRQKYSAWKFHPEKNYYYCKYEYKTSANSPQYQYDYCIYYKDDAKINNKWIYFYNPRSEKYWARYPTVNNDKYREYAQKRLDAWSELPQQYRQKDLYQIDAKRFPEPTLNYCPPIPGSDDKTPIMPPPADLP